MSLRRRRPLQWLTFESNKTASETIAISITRTAGAPDAAWRVVDGGAVYEYSGDALSHVVVSGPCKIEARIAPKWIDFIDMHGQGITSQKNLKLCSNLATLYSWSNSAFSLDLSDIASCCLLRVMYLDSARLIGDLGTISHLRLSILSIGGTLVSGSLSSIVAPDLIILDLAGCPCTGSTISAYPKIRSGNLAGQGASQARINAIVDDIDAHKGEFTYATPKIILSGDNAPPDIAHQAKISDLQTSYGWIFTVNS